MQMFCGFCSDISVSYLFQAEEDVEKFLKEEHSFDDYIREVRRYSKLEKEILYNSVKVHI